MKIDHFDQVVTPQQAEIWLKQNYKHQRPVSDRQVNVYTQAMLDEQFAPTSVLMFSVINGEAHLINGQQTLLAIIKSKKSQHLPILHYQVDAEADEANLYFKIDRQRKRSFADSVRATELSERTRLQPQRIAEAARALHFIVNDFGARTATAVQISDDDMLALVENWTWEVNAFWAAISPCSKLNRDLMRRRAVLSVALVTMRYQTNKAREFWRQIAQDDGLLRTDPRKALLTWMLNRSMQKRHGITVTRGSHGSEIARACAHAWNAFYDNRSLQIIQVANKSSRMYLKGTAYNGYQDDDFLPSYLSPHLEAERTGQPALL